MLIFCLITQKILFGMNKSPFPNHSIYGLNVDSGAHCVIKYCTCSQFNTMHALVNCIHGSPSKNFIRKQRVLAAKSVILSQLQPRAYLPYLN